MKKFLIMLLILASACCAFGAEDIENGRRIASKADLAFLWGSDTHYRLSGSAGASKELIDDFTAAANGIGVDFIAVTGDLADGYTSKENQLKDLAGLRSCLNEAKMPVMPAMGNHDDNTPYILGNAAANITISPDEIVPKETFFETVLKGHEDEFVRDEKNPYGGWYYRDFSDARIRVIVLNCIDIPYIPTGDGKMKYYGHWNYGYSDAQLNWLANKALRFSKKGWGVIIMTHIDFASPKLYDKNLTLNGDIVQKLLAAYTKKEMGTLYSDIEDFNAKVKYNFRSNASDEVIAVFAGHRHKNIYEYVGAVPHILVSNIFNKNSGGYDLVTIDRKKKTINSIRYINGGIAPQLSRGFVY